MSLLKRIFQSKPPPAPSVVHPVLGALKYDPTTKSWETSGSRQVYHGGIPGSAAEPEAARIEEVLVRMSNVDQYWRACESDLRHIASQYPSLPRELELKAFFRVVALSLYPGYWEICFETTKSHKWLYVGMQFEGESLVSNTIDT